MPNEKGDDSSSSSNNEFRVDEILKHRWVKGEIEYSVKWEGYPDSENTWEPTSSFFDKSVIDDYQKKIVKPFTVRGKKTTDEETSTSDPRDDQDSEFKLDDEVTGSGDDSESAKPTMQRRNNRKKAETAKASTSNENTRAELEKILDIREGEDDKLYCLVKVKEMKNPQYVTLETAHKHFPQELIAFYESRMKWLPSKNVTEPTA